MNIIASYGRDGGALYRGGFADVWKGEHCGRDVAVKVIRTYSDRSLQKTIGASFSFSSPSVRRCTDSVLCRGSARRL